MTREKRRLPAPVTGGPKERHKRAQRSQYDPMAPLPPGLVAKPAMPKIKHHSYFEVMENKDKKKKLEFQVTTVKKPPPGFEFVPIGDPELTTACKELSREKDAMIFIVSNATIESNHIAHQVHRIGHHIRETIVEEARSNLGQVRRSKPQTLNGDPEPIPESQEEYNRQVDAAIRDLFPRIPNTDRQMIIDHAFRRGATEKKPVGLSEDITLARRVQLAVLAHIRHNHTRYDALLQETTWQNARKAVEPWCLDTLVKWRGDEETGRDQLDEILREVVVISDSEDEDSDSESDSSIEEIEEPIAQPAPAAITTRTMLSQAHRPSPQPGHAQPGALAQARVPGGVRKTNRRNAGKKEKRGFKRYHAWEEALRRNREGQSPDAPQTPPDRHTMEFSTGPYDHLATRVPAPFSPNIQNARLQNRIASEDAGPTPHANGYVGYAPPAQHPPYHQPVYEKVNSPVPISDLSPTTSSPRVPRPLGPNPYQDLLVPSIEPASPNAMAPSFVRTLPPRGQAEHPVVRSNMRSSPRVLSPMQGLQLRDEIPSYLDRPSLRDPFNPSTRTAGDYRDNHGLQIPGAFRASDYASTHDRYPPVSVDATFRDSPVQQDAGRPAPPSGPQLVYRDGQSSGDRSKPILIKDCGGFFERVQVQQPTFRQFDEPLGSRRPGLDVRGTPGPHRVVSWEEGSRILRESQGQPGVEIIPLNRSNVFTPEPRPRSALVNTPLMRHATPEPMLRRRVTDWEPGTVGNQRPPLNPRPVSGDPGARRYQSYDDLRPRPFDAVPAQGSRLRPLDDDERRTPHRIPSGNPHNIIVLD